MGITFCQADLALTLVQVILVRLFPPSLQLERVVILDQTGYIGPVLQWTLRSMIRLPNQEKITLSSGKNTVKNSVVTLVAFAIVVGAGHNGLTTAAFLAKEGEH